MTDFGVEIDLGQIDNLERRVNEIPGKAQVAFNRTVASTGRRLRTAAVRDLAKATGAGQTRLRGRVRLSGRRRDDGRAYLYLYLNDLPATAFLTSAQRTAQWRRRKGVKVRGRTYPRSFWIRPRGNNRPLAFQRFGPGRRNIERIFVPIETYGRLVAEQTRQRVPDIFWPEYERQLLLALSK